jgi:hypothetical protein
MAPAPSITITLKEFRMDNENNRILGRILAVEELNAVAGGWTLGSEGDTNKFMDTGPHTFDGSRPGSESIASPPSSGFGR